MGHLAFLFVAYAAMWSGLFVFLLRIAKQLSDLEQEVKSIKQEMQ